MRAREFTQRVIDILEESTNELRLMLEQDHELFESLSGWDDINGVLDNIKGEQPQVGKLYSALGLTFTPPGRLLVIKGHQTPLRLVKVVNEPYKKYTFRSGNDLIEYPADNNAGDISYRAYLFSPDFNLEKLLTFITMRLKDWRITNRLQEEELDENGLTWREYPCTQDCSGHQAGDKWAQSRGIKDPDLCPPGNSNSWHEGCRSEAEGRPY